MTQQSKEQLKALKWPGYWLLFVLLGIALVVLWTDRGRLNAALKIERGEHQKVEELRQEITELRSVKAKVEEMAGIEEQNQELQSLRNRVRLQEVENQKLTQEILQLQQTQNDPKKIAQLREENQNLREQIEQTQTSVQTETAEMQRTICQQNLRAIKEAKKRYLQNNYRNNLKRNLSQSDLLPYLPEESMPQCPAGGVYSINQLGSDPTCNFGGHSL